jgi:flagellar biosynthesis/type III secretory pathway protein FliH
MDPANIALVKVMIQNKITKALIAYNQAINDKLDCKTENIEFNTDKHLERSINDDFMFDISKIFYDEGYDQGKIDAHEDYGYDEAYQDGYNEGYNEGITKFK